MKRKFLTFIAVAFAMAATAQEKTTRDYGDFTVDAQVRALGEYRGGMQSEDETESELRVNDRVRLSFGWERKNISMKIAAQHVGIWQNGSGQSTIGKLALHEAWARMAFGKGFFAQAGRQELSYDDERLLGAHDWAASGRAHDALRVGWENPRHKVHAIVAFNQTAEVVEGVVTTNSSSSVKLYKNMQTLWYHYGASQSPFQISGIFINQGASDLKYDSVRYMQTFGVYMTYAKSKISSDLSLYYQMGHDRTGTDIKAFMMSANFGWQIKPKWRLAVGDDYLSGGDGYPGTNRTFNVLYGSYHKFFGAMDNFTYSSIPLYGLNDLNVKVDFNCCPNFDVSLACHWLITGRRINDYLKDPIERIWDPAKILIMRRYNGKYRFSQNLGQEIDLELNYRPWKNITIQAGFSMMLATETMQFVKGTTADLQKWGWVSLNINPTVFSTK